MTIRAVAFDLDGLMFDTEALFFRVATDMLSSRGKVFSPEIMAAMIGRQAAVSYPAMKAMAGLDESSEELLAEARERFYALIDSAVHPTPGLFALLEHLERRGVPRAVCTSSRRLYAERLLSQHGLMKHFAFLLCAEDVTRSKPDPEIYRTASARFGVLPGEMLVLEDSPAGLAAAKAAGAFAVAVPHEHSPAEGLTGADMIVERLDDERLMGRTEDSPPGALGMFGRERLCLVPTRSVGIPSSTLLRRLRFGPRQTRAAERPRRHSHGGPWERESSDDTSSKFDILS